MMEVPVSAAAADGGQRSLLADSVAAFTGRGANLARARRWRGSREEYDRSVWRQIAELGWLGILVPEKYGGTALGLAEVAIVAEGLARSLAPEPYTATAVLAARALAAADNETLKQELLPQLVSGTLLPALAWQERAGELDCRAIVTAAVPFEGGYRVSGAKRFIIGAAQADGYLVTAKTAEGITLLWLPADAPGVERRLEPIADGRQFGSLMLHDVAVPKERVAASVAAARAALEHALDHTMAIIGAELYGVMSRALEMSLDYMHTRVQFGRPIGSFQALQHRAVDLYVQRELASAVLEEVLRILDSDPDAVTRARLASRVKARCSDAAAKITRETIQIHGAIGFTDEFDAGLYLKRALVLAAWLGSAAYHRRRYAALTASIMNGES